jgi:hypothetical protein
MEKYNYADLTKDQQKELKNAEDKINEDKENLVYLIAFKKDRK